MRKENGQPTTSVDRTVLLPCPFCGEEVDMDRHAFNKRYYVECRCSVECCTSQFDTPSEAAEAWKGKRRTL